MKQKTGSKLLGVLLALVMVLGLLPGMGLTAYAAEESESFITNQELSTYTGEHFKITCTDDGDGDGFYLSETKSATISARNGEIITKVEFTKGYYDIQVLRQPTGTTVAYNGDVATVSGVNATSLTVDAVDALQIKAVKVYYTIAAAHTHNFTYEASGATITAKCSAAGCTLTANPTLTIVAPTMTAYGQTGDGISASATLTGLTDFNTATGKTIAETNITYVGRDGTNYAESATAPTNAGKYTAKITVEGQTASVDYKIDKAQPTTPTGLTATYGQKLSDVTLPTGWSWKDRTQSVGNVGDNKFKANYAPTDAANYYSKVDVDVTVTVGKADPTAPTGLTATYGQTLENVTLPDGWTWADSTQSVGNVVDPAATFKANFAGNDNYKAASNVEVTVTVGKAAAAPATVTENDRTFDGTEKPLVTVDDSTLVGGTMWYAIGSDGTTAPTDGWDESIPVATDAGTYNVWFKVAGDKNHNDVDPDHVTVEIKKNDQQKADEVTALIKELPTFNKVRTSDEEDILAARAAYEALTDAQKKLVKLTAVRKLKNAETALAGAKKAELQKKKREIAEEQADENYDSVRDKRAEDAVKAKDDIKEQIDPIKTRSRQVQEALDDIDKSAKTVADKTRDAASKISRTTKRLIRQALDMIRRR